MNYYNFSEKDYYSLVSKRLNQIIAEKKLRQHELANLTGLKQSTISKIINGETKLNLQYIFKLCNALEIEPEALLSFNPDVGSCRTTNTNWGLLNEKYCNDKLMIRNTKDPAFKGYLGNTYYIYFHPTISSESSLLEGKLSFKDSESHNYCKAELTLYTGQKTKQGEAVTKDYTGELIISQSMHTCYVLLVSPIIGEICTINFKHTYLFNEDLACRVCTVNSTSSGGNKLPVIQRAVLSKCRLDIDTSENDDFKFIKGQLKLNDSNIIIPQNELERLSHQYSYHKELAYFFEKCQNYVQVSSYYVIEESQIRNLCNSSSINAYGISLLRNASIANNYNKISTKTEEFVFQYINSKNSEE